MRTGITVALATLLFIIVLGGIGNAQDCNELCSDSTKAPFSGLYLIVGPKFMDFKNLDQSLEQLGYSATDDGFLNFGLSLETLDDGRSSSRPTSSRLSVYHFGYVDEFHLGPGRYGEINGWGFSVAGIMPIVYTQSTRFAITLGLGFEWTELTVRREISFEDFINNATENATSAWRESTLLQPGLRFDYRFNLFGDPLILGIEGGYSWDFLSLQTWGNKIAGAPDDSNSGFFVLFSIGAPFRGHHSCEH